jgi:3-hydroxyacyl-[acyl-carrier-protein] dehydratase
MQQLDIERLLPHRDSSLYLYQADVEELSATGLAKWGMDHPVIIGHFPGYLMVPGMCLIEAAAQLGGLIIASQQNSLKEIGVLAGVKKVLLQRPVLPDQIVKFIVTITGQSQRFFIATGNATVAEKQVATFDFILSKLKKNDFHE